MFDHLTGPAKEVMSQARRIAQTWRHEYIGTEHLLWGILESEDSRTVRVVRELTHDRVELIRQAIRSIVPPNKEESARMALPFTPRAKRVLELAMEIAQSKSVDYLAPVHILRGIFAEWEASGSKNGIAAEALRTWDLGKADLEHALTTTESYGKLPELEEPGLEMIEEVGEFASELGDPDPIPDPQQQPGPLHAHAGLVAMCAKLIGEAIPDERQQRALLLNLDRSDEWKQLLKTVFAVLAKAGKVQ